MTVCFKCRGTGEIILVLNKMKLLKVICGNCHGTGDIPSEPRFDPFDDLHERTLAG